MTHKWTPCPQKSPEGFFQKHADNHKKAEIVAKIYPGWTRDSPKISQFEDI